tara:strand:- start:2285 stop:2800 length:516 start_codon:yes stop_codon:yes gene_type:complete
MKEFLSIIIIIGVVLAPIILLIVTLNKKMNKALEESSQILNFQIDIPGNIFRKKKIFGEIDGYRCEIEVFTRSYGRSSTTYVSFYAFFPESLDMGIKINWKGEIDGDDDHLTDLFVERNDSKIEEAQKILRRLRVSDTVVNSRKILFIKYYKSEEIVKTMRDVLNLAKSLK